MRIGPTQKPTPRTPADLADSAPRRTTTGGEISFDWGALVPHVVHPIKVAMVETIAWIGEPLSASQLEKVFEGGGYSVQVISYHAKMLAGWGVLEIVEERQVRGVVEKTYYFADRDTGSSMRSA